MSDYGQGQPRSLVKKLCDVMAAVERIPKRGWNSFHGYDYVTEADLADAVRAELSKRNIFIFPSVVNHQRGPLEVISLKGSRHTQITEIMVEWTFVDGDTGEERSIHVPGVGEDNVDKGFYKAFTGSEKYMLMKSFLVPTGDDPEADSKTDAALGKARQQEVASEKIAAAGRKQESITLTKKDANTYFLSGHGTTILSANYPGGMNALASWNGEMKCWEMARAKMELFTAACIEHGVDVLMPEAQSEIGPPKAAIPPAPPSALGRGVMTSAILKKTKQGREFVEVVQGGNKMSLFDNRDTDIGGKTVKLFDLILANIGAECWFLTESKESKGKTYHNITGVRRVGQYEWDEDGTSVARRDEYKATDADVPF